MFEHTVNVTATSDDKIVHFVYSGDMRGLRAAVESRMSDWSDIWYSKIEDPTNEGHIWR